MATTSAVGDAPAISRVLRAFTYRVVSGSAARAVTAAHRLIAASSTRTLLRMGVLDSSYLSRLVTPSHDGGGGVFMYFRQRSSSAAVGPSCGSFASRASSTAAASW